MSEEEYSDDFSREDLNQRGNKKTFLIDEAVKIERYKNIDQNINKIDNDSKKLKKTHIHIRRMMIIIHLLQLQNFILKSQIILRIGEQLIE